LSFQYSLDSEEEEDQDQQPTMVPDSMAFPVERYYRSSAVRMAPKVPPTFDGQFSGFEFEDLIDDWFGSFSIDP